MPGCLVVGDSYSQLADGDVVVPACVIRQRLVNGDRWLADRHFVMGQGLSDADQREIRELARARRLDHHFAFAAPKTDLALTHKRCEEHVLLSGPARLDDGQYEFGVLVDECVDRLSDHVTGLHIGGMVLIEAGRQATIAILEMAYRGDDQRPLGLVWNTLRVQFSNYAFPVPTKMLVRLTPTTERAPDVGRGGRGHAISLLIQQAAAVVCEMELDVVVYEAEALSKIERRRAQRAVGSALAPGQVALAPGSKVA